MYFYKSSFSAYVGDKAVSTKMVGRIAPEENGTVIRVARRAITTSNGKRWERRAGSTYYWNGDQVLGIMSIRDNLKNKT